MTQMLMEIMYVVGAIKSVKVNVTASIDNVCCTPRNRSMVHEMVNIGNNTFVTEL